MCDENNDDYLEYHEQQKQLSYVCGNPDDYDYDAHEELSHTSNHVLYRKDSEKAKEEFSRMFTLYIPRRGIDDDDQPRDRLFYAQRYYDIFNGYLHLIERFPGLKELDKDYESVSKLWWFYRQQIDRLKLEEKRREEQERKRDAEERRARYEQWRAEHPIPYITKCPICNDKTLEEDYMSWHCHHCGYDVPSNRFYAMCGQEEEA